MLCRAMRIAVVLGIGSGLWVGPGVAAPADPAARARAPAAAPTTGPASQPLAPGDFGTMVGELRIEGEQLKDYLAKVQAREEALAKWERSSAGQKRAALTKELQAAREARNEALAANIEGKLAPIEKEYWALRTRQRSLVLCVLNHDQRMKMAGYWLHHQAHRACRRAGLTPEQEQQARILCDQLACQHIKATWVLTDPYLFEFRKEHVPLAVEEIKAKVLTAEQRAKLAPATRPATRPATTAPAPR